MLTYLVFDLKRKKFYVGSTKRNFEQRQSEHLANGANAKFPNTLRKRPETFYWICSDDDGLDTRDEEQFYLDFYHGSVWCYNESRMAHGGSAHQGKHWYYHGDKEERFFEGEQPKGWKLGRCEKSVQKFKEAERGPRSLETNLKHRATIERKRKEGTLTGPNTGKILWTDGEKICYAFECPGEGWMPQKKPSSGRKPGRPKGAKDKQPRKPK